MNQTSIDKMLDYIWNLMTAGVTGTITPMLLAVLWLYFSGYPDTTVGWTFIAAATGEVLIYGFMTLVLICAKVRFE